MSKLYPNHIRDFIEKNHKGAGPKRMAELLNENFGTSYTRMQLKSYYSNHRINSETTGYFQKGHTPHNKGKKLECIHPNSAATQFKAGNVPHNKLPVGSIVMKSDGYMWQKLGEGAREWKQKHILVWEEVHGPVPDGCLVTFKDGDHTNYELDNLALITRAESLELTRRGLRTGDAALTETGILIAKLNCKIKKKGKQQNAKIYTEYSHRDEIIVLDLFCGTKSVAKAFEARGHKVYTVDWDKRFNPSLAADIGKLTAQDIINLCGGVPTVIWASPDCTTYSVAAISKHRRKDQNGSLQPISDYAKQCDTVNKHLIELLQELKPKYWFIENPRAAMRKMDFMQDLPRYTVTYCKYGEKRMKPTDIWTNHPNPQFEPPCKNGDTCHEAAPRGASTGTQSLKNRIEKARIPQLLCEHIVDICEG